MFPFKYPVPQTEEPRSPKETLPTMYDLPSEDPEEPGLPDEFHSLQPQLLSLTFRPPNYSIDRVFTASDMNLYYDVRHFQWYKRPDWFAVVGVPRLYEQGDMRLSYLVWQEGVNPFVVVELLSPGTEKEDLGEVDQEKIEVNGQAIAPEITNKPPRKWQVYEQILRIPYYIVFSRYTNELKVFTLNGAHYQQLELPESRIWMPEIDLGLGLWQGEYLGVERLWLRWYDDAGNWILTPAEQERQWAEQVRQRAEQARQRAEQAESRVEQEQQRAEQERQRAEQAESRVEQERQRAEQERQRAEQAEAQFGSLIQKMRESGIDPDPFLNR